VFQGLTGKALSNVESELGEAPLRAKRKREIFGLAEKEKEPSLQGKGKNGSHRESTDPVEMADEPTGKRAHGCVP